MSHTINPAPAYRPQSDWSSMDPSKSSPPIVHHTSNTPRAVDDIPAENKTSTTGAYLPPASETFSSDDMIYVLQALAEKVSATRIKTSQKSIEADQIKVEQNHKTQIDKVNEWSDKSAAAAKAGELGKIFDWIGKAAAIVGSGAAVLAAGAATVATGGAAAPVLVLASYSLINSGLGLADKVSQEKGGPPISIGAGVAKICSEVGDFDQETLDDISNTTNITAEVTATVAGAVATGGASTSITVAARAAQVGSTVISGASEIGKGVVNIDVAIIQADADNAVADQKKLAAFMLKLQQSMEDERKVINDTVMELDEATHIVTNMLRDTADTMRQINHNMGSSAAHA